MTDQVSGLPTETLLPAVRDYYERRLREHGATAAGVDWNSPAGQTARFDQLDLAWRDLPEARICDLGCGYGGYARHVADREFRGSYLGVDVSPAMIEQARALHLPSDRYMWVVGDAAEPADVVVASGTFHVIPEGMTGDYRAHWAAYVHRCLADMVRAARHAIAVNLLLPPSPPYRPRPELFTAEPGVIVDLLTTLGLQVEVHTGYGPHEATYIGRRAGARAS